MKRYHKDVYMPKNLDFEKFWNDIDFLVLSYHFIQRFSKRRNSKRDIKIPDKKWCLENSEIFEVYAENSKIVKVGIKVPGEKVDSCYIIGRNGTVLTVWSAKKNHTMKFDRTLYERGK